MKKILRSIIIGITVLLCLFVIIALACLKPVDTTPYSQTEFYKKQLAEIDAYKAKQSSLHSTDTLDAGWARVNLLPPFATPIAIDAHRGGKPFEGVHDSVYVRAFVFRQGNVKAAFISADLLIIPPSVTVMFDTLLKQQGFDNSNIYFTATHTHASIGAWQDSYVGEIFAGKYDARVPQHIAACISSAIAEAEKNCSSAQISYGAIGTSQLVFNRLVKEKGKVDSLLRVVKIIKPDGQKAAIITFAAHATVFHESLMKLSADWPGLMMTELEKSGAVNFACFSAGAVGSQGPYPFSEEQETEARYMAEGVAGIIKNHIDSLPLIEQPHLSAGQMHLYLREPNLRVSSQLAVRPWLFYRLFGNNQVHLKMLRLGSLTFIGTPCDFSGELLHEPGSQSEHKILITSFNGGYIGYVTDDKWYALNTYETRTMGWFGPGTGAYLSEVIYRTLGP